MLKLACLAVVFFSWLLPLNLPAQETSTKLILELDKPGAAVSPVLYGLMTEEINHSYDGGLYGELVQNRIFKDDPKEPVHWSIVKGEGGKGAVSLDRRQPVNDALVVSLRLDVEDAGKRVGIANDGYWGIPVRPATSYHASFYAKASGNAGASAGAGTSGEAGGVQVSGAAGKELTVSIESNDGAIQYASASVSGIGDQWQRYTVTLTTPADSKTTADARLVIAAGTPGTYWFNLVSLFPPTYHNRVNGNRTDIMQLLAGMKPAFLRFPGGNFVEGNMFSSRFAWKKTVGGLEDRPGHDGCWKYRASDGLGLLEFLEWCEDIRMEPLLAVFAGYTLNKDYLDAGPLLKPFVDEALEEIEYVTGDTTTTWGRQRARDGHPEPFTLHWVEVGNEDAFDISGSYERRFKQFYDAIRAKYPTLTIISTVGGKDPLGRRFQVRTCTPDILDEHYYRSAMEMEEDAAHYDDYSRMGPKIFVGEWATREGFPTTNFNAALGDAAWMTGMERNSDMVTMSCYAPLFVNVNPGGMQWKSDLIGYDALSSYGSPSYYAQKMFSNYIGKEVVSVHADNIPTQIRKLSGRDSANGVVSKQIPSLFFVATRDAQAGKLYLKVVNAGVAALKAEINLDGKVNVKSEGSLVQLRADKPEDTNTIQEPEKIVPHVAGVRGIGKHFSQVFPPYSISVLVMDMK
jgi:alpha-N-arabinofuranosidase